MNRCNLLNNNRLIKNIYYLPDSNNYKNTITNSYFHSKITNNLLES